MTTMTKKTATTMATQVMTVTTATTATTPGARVALAAGLLAMLGACALPQVQAPEAPAVPAQWQAVHGAAAASAVAMAASAATASVSAPASAPGAGTDSFAAWDDPVLHALLARARTANRDLRQAALRLDLAVADARIAGLLLEPQLGLSASLGTSRALSGAGTAAGWQRSAGATLSASWTPDLWGQLRGQARQAGLAVGMAEDDQRALRWDLQSRVAEQYWAIAKLQAARTRLDEDERAAAETLAAQRLKLSQGTLRPTDVDVAVADLRGLALQRQQNTLALETARRALAALVDAPPQDFALPRATLPRTRATLPEAGPPMAVLDARPDVHRARLALDQALLGERIARVNRYPSLSLNSSVASGGAGWRHLLDDPGLSLGLGLALPFVQWRELGVAQDQAATRKEIAGVQFRDVLWLALADVAQRQEDVALSLATLADAQAQVDEAARLVAQARVRLEAGVAAPQELRDAQRALRAARNREDEAWRAQASAWLALRRALGGDPGPA